MLVVGLGHYSRVGKDSFADAFVNELCNRGITARKMPFAWKLKEVCHQLYGWAGVREPEYYDAKDGEKYRDIVLEPLQMTPVELWVRFGTMAVRNEVYDLTWVDYLLNTDHGTEVLVIPDVRFPNEVRRIREHRGKLIKVVRPGYGPRLTVADLSLVRYMGWDAVIGDSGNIEELYGWAKWCAEGIQHDGGHWGYYTDTEMYQDDLYKEQAYSVEVIPSDEEIRQVFEKEGMSEPTFTE